MAHGVAASQSVVAALGERALSLAARSLTETKDTLLIVCIALLDAMDRLQERLHLPTALVKELKRKLAMMIDRSSSSASAPSTAPRKFSVGAKLAESTLWDDVSRPEQVRGVVHWVIAVIKYLNDLVISSSLSVCRGIFILIMRVPGVSTACALFHRVLQLVEDTVRQSSESIIDMAAGSGLGDDAGAGGGGNGFHRSHHRHHHRPESYIGDPSMTAVVLEYREKECMVPSSIDQRIRRVMHFQIPLRSFEATVRLPPNNGAEGGAAQANASNFAPVGAVSVASMANLTSATPRSIPVSPRARRRVQLAFSNFSDDILYQARDRLRQERAATLTGTRDLLVPLFNGQDCNEEIYLSCGRHCATKVGSGMYRSVRGSVPLPRNRLVYFEMTLQEARSPTRAMSNRAINVRGLGAGTGDAAGGCNTSRAGGGVDASVCIGVSTRSMALNSLVGTSRYSVGFYSAGHVLIGANRRSFVPVNRGYGFQSTVGVLAKVTERREGEVAANSGDVDGGRRSGNNGGSSWKSSRPAAISTAGPQSAEASVRFTVDGVALRDSNNEVMEFTIAFPAHSELYPTLTLHSQGVQVFGRFSAPDIAALDVAELGLSTGRVPAEELWCLDGLQLVMPT